MQLTDTMLMPSTMACPVAGNSAYVARPSMSDRSSPESATAALTAWSACAARGISADRVILENPTPLTATLHLFSHITTDLLLRLRLFVRQPELRQRDIVVQLLEDYFHAPSHLCLGIGRAQQIASQQGAWCRVELHNDAGIGYGRGKAFVPSVVHDGVGIDSAFAWHGLEREVG